MNHKPLLLLSSHSIVSNSLQPHGLQHTRLPLSFTISQSLLKLMSIESVIPSNHLILCHSLLLLLSIFPSIRVFSNDSDLLIRWPKYWSFSLKNQSFRWTSGLISFRTDWFDFLLSKGLPRVFSTTIRKHQFFDTQPFLCPALTSVHDYWKNHSFDFNHKPWIDPTVPHLCI